MNRKIISMLLLLAAIFISLSLGSYKFLVSNKPASLPSFVETFKEGAAVLAKTTSKAPAVTTHKAPAKTTSKAPVKTTSKPPTVTTHKAPAVTTHKAPAVTTYKAPVKNTPKPTTVFKPTVITTSAKNYVPPLR